MRMSTQRDWARDYDVFDPAYAADPYPIWDELRATCPVAHTERHGGSWLTTTYDDVTMVARDQGSFSSRNVSVVPPPDGAEAELLPAGLPPIEADPPVHTWTRRLLLPWFSNDCVAEYEDYTRQLCRTLLDGFADTGPADAAAHYAKQLPVRVIGKMLGIPEEMSDTFIEWVRSVLEFANDGPRRTQAQIDSTTYFLAEMEARRSGDGTDLISELMRSELQRTAPNLRSTSSTSNRRRNFEGAQPSAAATRSGARQLPVGSSIASQQLSRRVRQVGPDRQLQARRGRRVAGHIRCIRQLHACRGRR